MFETFTRVWGAGGQASLHLHTQDGRSRATLNIELGPTADPRPGAPAPSIMVSDASSGLAAVDLLLVLEMWPGTLPGSRVKSSRLKLNQIAEI